MKYGIKIVALFCLLMIGTMSMIAQVIPKGMHYQAIARSSDGLFMPVEAIDLSVVLYSTTNGQSQIYYKESHTTVTDSKGLFDLVIGEGNPVQGEFGLIPWNKENIWMEVSAKAKNKSSYVILNSSRLMAVPYAMHAGTADKLVDSKKSKSTALSPPEPGVISTEWSVLGNAKTDASGNIFRSNSLGTTDFIDLIMITNNEEQLRIRAGGDIFVKLNFEIGKDLKVGQNLFVTKSFTVCDTLTVKKNVLLNVMNGRTDNYGPFTVAGLSPTIFTGTLTVVKEVDFNALLNVDSTTNLNSRLYVTKMGPTRLTGTLQVDSVTNFNGALYVNQIGATVLSGTLTTDSCATFNDKVKVTSMFSTDTTTTAGPSGSLQVGGGAYIKGNFFIGGIAKLKGPVVFGGQVTLTNTTQSNDPMSGALVVSGGTGIGLNLNVGGGATLGQMTTILDGSEAFNDSTGALKVRGGAGFLGRLHVGGNVMVNNTLFVNGPTTLNSTLTVRNGNQYIANFVNSTIQHGISIQVNNASPGYSNTYMEFRGGSGNVVGRIKGENISQYTTNKEYIIKLNEYETNVLLAELNVAAAASFVAAAATDLIAAATSITPCFGFGACVTTPIPALIATATAVTVVRAGGLAAASIRLVRAKDEKNDFVALRLANVGVTYESGSGDYAEWLPKLNKDEQFLPGHIVSTTNGKITKDWIGSSRWMVISTKPIVLGNMQDDVQKADFEKVAFMGQVPVFVIGPVHVGDYILPNKQYQGYGKAIAPANMKVEDYQNIVGVAWSSSGLADTTLINTAIGLNSMDFYKVVLTQEKYIQQLESAYQQSNNKLTQLVPGFKNKLADLQLKSTDPITSVSKDQPGSKRSSYSALEQFKWLNLSASSIETQVELLIATGNREGAEEFASFVHKYQTDPNYKNKFIQDVQTQYSEAMEKEFEKFNLNNLFQK